MAIEFAGAFLKHFESYMNDTRGYESPVSRKQSSFQQPVPKFDANQYLKQAVEESIINPLYSRLETANIKIKQIETQSEQKSSHQRDIFNEHLKQIS